MQLALDSFRVYQVAVTEVEERTRLQFPTPVHDANDLVLSQFSTRNPLYDTSAIAW